MTLVSCPGCGLSFKGQRGLVAHAASPTVTCTVIIRTYWKPEEVPSG